jgi:hypothetical protein
VLTSSRCSLRWQPHSRIIPVSRARCTQPGPARVMSASWKAWSANHNAISECLPPWPRSVVRSAAFLSTRPGRKQQRLRKRCGPKQSGASCYWLALSSPWWSWASTRLRDASERIATYQLGPHFAHLDLPPHSLGGRRLARNLFFVAGLELKWELVAGDLPAPGRPVLPVVPPRWPHSPSWYSSPECAAGVPSDAGRHRGPDRDRDHRRRVHVRARAA